MLRKLLTTIWGFIKKNNNKKKKSEIPAVTAEQLH